MTDIKNYGFVKKLGSLAFVEKIILFGSRARGDGRDRSDIDLAIICELATDQDWLKVLDIVEDADTLLKIDCVRLDTLPASSELKKNIIQDGEILYENNILEK